MRTVGTKLDLDTIRLLEEKAKKEGKNKYQILKELIVDYISDNKVNQVKQVNEINEKKSDELTEKSAELIKLTEKTPKSEELAKKTLKLTRLTGKIHQNSSIDEKVDELIDEVLKEDEENEIELNNTKPVSLYTEKKLESKTKKPDKKLLGIIVLIIFFGFVIWSLIFHSSKKANEERFRRYYGRRRYTRPF